MKGVFAILILGMGAGCWVLDVGGYLKLETCLLADEPWRINSDFSLG
jgi:hypothetical protein